MKPLISIGMPCYNRLEQLRGAIDCIRNQTYQNVEIIISNDASPNPEIYKMLDELAAKDPRIKLFHQPVDLGVYGNYHFVLTKATGEYFMYAQDDDIWEPDCIEVLVNHLEQHPEQMMAISAVRYIGKHGVYATYRFTNENLYSLIFGEKIAFLWMGMWRTERLRLFDRDSDDIHGKDIIIGAEAVMSMPFGYVDKVLYNKTLYYDKALKYVVETPSCLLQMYKHFIIRLITSRHILPENKPKLVIILPLFGIRVVMMYFVTPIYLLEFYHRARTKSRKEYNRWFAND